MIGQPSLESPAETASAGAPTGKDRSTEASDLVPLWFERGLVIACAAVLSFGAVGLLFAVLGDYRMLTVFLLGAAGTVLSALVAWPRRRASGSSRSAVIPAIGMCLVALGFALWNGVDAGHHVAIGRDPGAYTVAGKWIAVHGGLQVPTVAEWLSKDPTVRVNSPGIYIEGDHVEFQFNHLTPVLFAEADNLGGDGLMFRVTTVLGTLALCAIYAVGCRLTRRPWLALAAVSALAVSLPQLNVSRDTYSEPAVEFLLWVGIYLLLKAYESRRFGVALLAGAALGGTMLGRIDALVYLIPLPLVGAGTWVAAPSSRRSLARMCAAVALGALPLAVLGTIDVRDRAGSYYTDLGSEVTRLHGAFVLSVVAGLVLVLMALLFAGRFAGLTEWVREHRQGIAVTLAFVVSIGLVLAWTLRPVLFRPRWVAYSLIGALQRNAGLAVDPRRTYSEATLRWFSWYLGPITVGLAIVGVAVLLIRAGRRLDAAVTVVLSVAGTGTALYLWKPSILPDQIWAMRRFVPAGLPLFVLLAACALAALIPAPTPGRRRPAWARPAAVAAAIGLIAFPLAVTGPVRNLQPQAGYLVAVNEVCQRTGSNAAILFVSADDAGQQLAAAARSWCNVPVARMTKPMSSAQLGQLAAKWRADGRELWVLSSAPGLMTAAAPGLTPSLVATASSPHELEMTINRPPQYYVRAILHLYAAHVSA